MTVKEYKFGKTSRSEFDKVVRVIGDALLIPEKDHVIIRKYLRRYGESNLRSLKCGSEIAGGLFAMRWGHFFGGKSVPAAGVAFVGVAPEYRRTGAASLLMAEAVREFYREGLAISTLFPANMPLYRKSGYEFAIELCMFKLRLENIRTRNMRLEVIRYEGSDPGPFRDVYRHFVGNSNGNVDRPDSQWAMVLDPIMPPGHDKFLVMDGEKVVGYIVTRKTEEKQPMWICDYAVRTREAAERLLTFLGDHSSVIEYARWAGSSRDTLAMLLPSGKYEIEKRATCMLRIVSVPGALRSRGYPKGIEAEVHLDVADDIVEENNGRWILKVKNGKGTVRKGGEGRMKINIRSLAQMYSGLLSPDELCIIGELEAGKKELEMASAVFAGPSPWICDSF